jgi:hypothetical protein
MPLYNVYAGEAGRMSRVYSFSAADDVAAKQFVKDRLTDVPVELWCYSKRVARFDGKSAP